MPTPAGEDITRILADLSGDDQAAATEWLPRIYQELRALSEVYLRGERPDHTLQATALVHEAYLHLAGTDGSQWKDRTHFLRVAAKTMRRILINHAVAHRSQKRGGGRRALSLTGAADMSAPHDAVDVLALDEALSSLAAVSEQKARIVELRYFAGCTIDETAETLGVSTATVERDWRFARAWLRAELDDPTDS